MARGVAIATNGSSFATIASGARFINPSGIAVGNGVNYVSEPGASNTVWQLPRSGGAPTALLSSPTSPGPASTRALDDPLERFNKNCSRRRCSVRPLAESVEPEARRYNPGRFNGCNIIETALAGPGHSAGRFT
jgi:hypothetical protein